MPLRRGTITVASRVMLPTYVLLTTTIGLVYLLDPLHRLHSLHALVAPQMLMPMPMWGLLFLAVAGLMVAALIASRRLMFVLALYVCGSTFTLWAAMYAWSAFIDSQVSVLAPVYPLFVVAACYASARSLLRGEV